MARKIKSRYKIKGTLVTQSPIHVGGVGGNADTDMALAVNGEGDFYIPATSLAGALRSWMEIINPKITNRLWGYQSEQSEDKGHASFIIVEDAPISSSVIMEVRDGVAIDRFLGTAVNGMKYDRAILPKYTKIPLRLTLERDNKLNDKQWQEYQQLFAQLINALIESDIYIGGAKSRGLGKVKLYQKVNPDEQLPTLTQSDLLSITKNDLLTPKGILDLLNAQHQDECECWNELYTSGHNYQNKLNINISWHPISSVMVKSDGDGIAVDMLPLVSRVDNDLSFVIPGSSLKGVWRSQAERIIRTVADKPLDYDENKPRDKFQEHIKLDLVKTLFGAMAELDSDGNQLGGLSSLYFEDCYAQLAIKDNQWEEVINAQDDRSLRNALDNIELKNTEQVYHVAINRWTGGASEGALYTVLEPKGFNWQPIEISLDLDRLKRQLKHNDSLKINDDNTEKNNEEIQISNEDLEIKIQQHLALFLLVLRDFIASKIPIGFGTNRGMGAIKISQIEVVYKGEETYLQNLFVNKKNNKENVSINFWEQFDDDSLKIIDTAWQKLH